MVLKEYLKRYAELKAFPWVVVELGQGVKWFFFKNCAKSFRETATVVSLENQLDMISELRNVGVLPQDLVMLDCNGIHRLLSSASALDDKPNKLALVHLKKRVIDRDVPEVLDEGHGGGESWIVGPGIQELIRLEQMGLQVPPARQACGTYPGDPDYDLNNSRLYENGLAFDVCSQVGALLKSPHPSNTLGKPAKRAYLVGESQSGAYIITLLQYIHPHAMVVNGMPVYDGYLIEARRR